MLHTTTAAALPKLRRGPYLYHLIKKVHNVLWRLRDLVLVGKSLDSEIVYILPCRYLVPTQLQQFSPFLPSTTLSLYLKMPELAAGKYMISNTATMQHATLSRSNEGEQIKGALKNGSANQKASAAVLPIIIIPLFLCLDIPQWFVEKLDNGTYYI